ncbi:WD repeat-containing protein 18 [Lycorma delicatula]|uniref:WD repeat-containing protein 18 n=1 Tax=Lycorma delicatula TaxID=130591 RepID=UPI003F51352D
MNEVLFTSSSGDSVVSVNVWDSKTGTSLMSYRGGGVINPNGLSMLGSDYLIAVEKSKPLLQVWPINSQQPIQSPRLLCPGKVSVMACSPDGCYIALSVDEKLHVYQVSSGCLVGSGARHFQPITVIRWCFDGSVIVCGGEDGMVTVWNLSNLLNKNIQQSISVDSNHVFNDHSLPVTDLIITSGGSSFSNSRLISVSSDRTCKIYKLSTGKLLLSVVFTEMLTSVSITPSEMDIFVGCASGDINQFSLRDGRHLNSLEIHISTGVLLGDNITDIFSGHKKSVTCLSTSIDGERLLSGSADETVRIWHIMSKQCLKVLNLKGPVTNAYFIKVPKEMFQQDVKRNIILRPFQKTSTDAEDSEYCLEIINYHDLDMSCYELSNNYPNVMMARKHFISDDDYSLKDELNRLRNINEQLYKIGISQFLQKRTNEESLNQQTVDVAIKNNDEDVISDANNFFHSVFDQLEQNQKQPNLRNKNNRKIKRKVVTENTTLTSLKMISKRKKKK